MVQFHRVGRSLAWLGLLVLLLGASAQDAHAKKRRRRPPKKPPVAAADSTASGDALKDVELSARDGAWYLKNRNQTQRVVLLLRFTPSDRPPSLHGFSLEPGQEVAVGVRRMEDAKKPRVVIVSAQYE